MESDFYKYGKVVKSKTSGNVIAKSFSDDHAEIISKALNDYFDNKSKYTGNEAVAMMHKNTANALSRIANFCTENEYTAEMMCEYMLEVSEEMNAQALVVEMRDDLKFDKALNNDYDGL